MGEGLEIEKVYPLYSIKWKGKGVSTIEEGPANHFGTNNRSYKGSRACAKI